MSHKAKPYYYLAVDPGKTGCIVILDIKGMYVDHFQMPTKIIGKDVRVDGGAIAESIRLTHHYIGGAFIEQVGAMPGQGVSSMFAFGYSAGAAQGAIEALKIPCYRVRPQKWKKHWGLTGKEKDAARLMLLEEFGDKIPDLTKKGKGQALADAILMGRCGLVIHLEQEKSDE